MGYVIVKGCLLVVLADALRSLLGCGACRTKEANKFPVQSQIIRKRNTGHQIEYLMCHAGLLFMVRHDCLGCSSSEGQEKGLVKLNIPDFITY